MALSIDAAFLIVGGIIAIGYIGELLSKRFAIPSALLLLAIGYFLELGGYVDAGSLEGIQGMFGSLALAVILFDGGISLNLADVIGKSGRVLVNSFLLTVLGMAGAAVFFMLVGLDPLLGAIMGAIAGGIGSTTTISMIRSLPLPQTIRTFLTLESSLTDIFSIIFALVLTQALVEGIVDIEVIGIGALVQFSIGLLIGLFMGLLSLSAPSSIQKGYGYMITFAMVLVCYSVTGLVGGNGAISVLVLGIVFGNDRAFREFLSMGRQPEGYPVIRELQSEVTFFIRTFFFVFLGVVVSLGSLQNFLIAVGFVAFLYLIRFLSIRLVSYGSKELSGYRGLLTAVNPRGLATAVLATLPLLLAREALAASPDARLAALLPQLEIMPEIAFYLILLSILATTVLVPLSVRKKRGGRGAAWAEYGRL